MSATLTWKTAGPYATNTAATAIGLLTDFKALMDSNAANPDYLWEVCSSSLASTPIYLTLRRKDASAGRILIIAWTSAPAGNNSAILDTAPNANNLYMCYFPSGNVSTPSNLTASSGTVMGDDTNCVKAACIGQTFATIYSNATFRVSYVESNEAVFLLTQANTGAAPVYGGGAGELLVDGSDVTYGAVIGPGTGSFNAMGAATTTNSMVWSVNAVVGGATNPNIHTNQGVANRSMFLAWTPSATWTSQVPGLAVDPTRDATNGVAFFFGVPVLGNVMPKSGTGIKLRQMAFGQACASAWQTVNSTGPVTQAVAPYPFSPTTQQATLWLTNFKI